MTRFRSKEKAIAAPTEPAPNIAIRDCGCEGVAMSD